MADPSASRRYQLYIKTVDSLLRFGRLLGFQLIVRASHSVLSKYTKHRNESPPHPEEEMLWPCCGQINQRTEALQIRRKTQGFTAQISQFEQWLIIGFALSSPISLSIDFLPFSCLLSYTLQTSTYVFVHRQIHTQMHTYIVPTLYSTY